MKLVAGRELRAKLGLAAWLVWQRALRLRGPGNRYFASVRGMAAARGQQALSVRTVERAVCLLREAGLIHQPLGTSAGKPDGEDGADGLGFQSVDTPRGTRRVFVRRVFGAMADPKLHRDGTWFEVPDATGEWLALSREHTHGGSRRGAGRPKKASPGIQAAGTLSASWSIQAAGTPGIQAAGVVEILRREEVASDLLASLGDARGSSFADPTGVSRSRIESGVLRAILNAPDLIDETGAGDAPTLSRRLGALMPEAGAVSQPLSPEVGERLGAILTGARTARAPSALPSDSLRGVPPFPGASLLGQARVPRPPELDRTATPDAQAMQLAHAYRCAVRSRFRQEAWALKRGPITRSKFYKTLLACAALLVEHEIAPAAWAAWSCDQWTAMGNGTKPPPVPWVFSPKRISEHHGWFGSDEGSYNGGRIVTPSSATELRRRYLAMREALVREGATTEPKEVVARFFPGRTFEAEVEIARAEIAHAAADLRRRVAAGEFMW